MFHYVNGFKHCNHYSDSSSQSIQFEIPNNSKAFKFSDSASLTQANAVFSFWAAGAEEALFIKEGRIEGVLSGDKWFVTVNVTTPLGGNSIRFESLFKPI